MIIQLYLEANKLQIILIWQIYHFSSLNCTLLRSRCWARVKSMQLLESNTRKGKGEWKKVTQGKPSECKADLTFVGGKKRVRRIGHGEQCRECNKNSTVSWLTHVALCQKDNWSSESYIGRNGQVPRIPSCSVIGWEMIWKSTSWAWILQRILKVWEPRPVIYLYSS